MALEIYLEGTLNGETLAEAETGDGGDTSGAGLRSDGELVQAVSESGDAFVFVETSEGGFSDVSGLGAEITVAEYREGSAYSPEWTNLGSGDPGIVPEETQATYDMEYRYVSVRRTADEDDDGGMIWGDDGFL